jgi:hypothetical protein
LKTAPREWAVKRKTAGKQLSQLTRETLEVIREELDVLMPQFKDTQPAFHSEYFAARAIVDAHHGKAAADVVPAPAPEPLAKVA